MGIKAKGLRLEKKTSKLRTFLHLSVGAVIYALFFEVFYCWMRYGDPFPFSFEETALSIAYNFIPIYFLVFCNYLLIFRLNEGQKPLVSAVVCLILSTVILIIIGWLFTLFTGFPVEYAGTVFCNLMIIAGLESVYYAHYSKLVQKKHALQEQETLIYKYEALKAQINPHFLFNSLNILYSFIPPDNKDAREYVLHLSKIYRFTLNHNDKPEVSVRTELDFLNSYIRILEIRYNDNLKVNISLSPGAEEKKIIPYSLQMLVENVTKHNFISYESPMTVDIKLGNDGITVSNPLRPKESDMTSTRFGLSYLKHLYSHRGKEFTAGKSGSDFIAFVPYL